MKFSVIYVMWLRQVKRAFRSKSRIIGALGQPLLFLFAFGLGFSPIFQKAGEGDYINFLVPGIVAMGILFTSIFSGIEMIWDRQFGFLKETLVAPVSRLDIMIGRTLGSATIAVLQGIIILVLSLFIGFKFPSFNSILITLLFMILIALTFTALGTAIASKMQDFHGFQLIMNFLVMPLFFLSGAIFPLHNLPNVVSIITKLDPLSYGVDGIRGALTGNYFYGLTTNFLVLFGICSIFMLVGSYLFSRIQI